MSMVKDAAAAMCSHCVMENQRLRAALEMEKGNMTTNSTNISTER